MAVRPILTWGDPRLKIDSSDIGAWTEDLERLVEDLFETGYAEEGLGIAAPQVGVNLNLAVVDLSCGQEPERRIVLINPEIVRTAGAQKGPEGCLSVPGIHEVLERPREVWVRTRRRDGSWEELYGEDLQARAFCHEIDHLRGRLFLEYFGPVKRQVIKRKYEKLRKG